MNAVEYVQPICRACGCHLRCPDSGPFMFLLWSRCSCGWAGLARFWRQQ